jgi:SNF2 family DNA or RNA helicase
MELYEHQKKALENTSGKNRVAYYMDMGLGKTHTSSEKMIQLGAKFNLVVCQKSKVDDWYNHFKDNYDVNPCDLTKVKAKDLEHFIEQSKSVPVPTVYVINYDLVWRRKQLLQLKDFTLILDESSLIQNEQAKRSKFILKLQPKNVILLSGTPTSGRYETLWSQMHLLGWKISKELYLNTYVDYHWDESNGFPVRIIDGYKNVDRLKRKMRQYGCYFLKTEDVLDLPEQIDQTIKVPVTTEYQIFKRDRICTVEDNELVGDTVLTKLLYQRQLCGQYNSDKLEAFRDLVESTNERLIVFYNFNAELYKLWDIAEELSRPISAVNGNERSLREYETQDNSITFIQYQAGSKGLNLQKANRIIFFTPTLSAEDYLQARKRIHRINQTKTCFYYHLVCESSVEEKIYRTLAKREDYTNALFESEEE